VPDLRGDASQQKPKSNPVEAAIVEIPEPESGSWLRFPTFAGFNVSKLTLVGYSVADQAFAVGGNFLANIALARTQTKEDYGMFALYYSVFTFLAGLHNAAVLEPYTVYASGRYRNTASEYLRLMARSNAIACVVLSVVLLLGTWLLSWVKPGLAPRALIGLGFSVGAMLSGIFLRRAFYVERRADLAAKSSLTYLVVVVIGLAAGTYWHRLDSLTLFLLFGLGWLVAGTVFGPKLNFGKPEKSFHEVVPDYWREHWSYMRWILGSAFVFQFTSQGYYWLVGVFLSAREVGELRAMYNLIAPIDQVFIAMSYVVVPALAAHYASKRLGNFLSLWKKLALVTVVVTGAFALIVRSVGKPGLHLLYAGRYDGLTEYVYVLAFLPLVMWLGTSMAQALFAAEKPKFVFYAYVGGGIATFLGGIPLVVHYGLSGAIHGMFLSGVAYTGVLAGFFFWQFKVLPKRVPQTDSVA
jgi:O-antigen/teichoic acid export membrane protein